MYTSVPFLITAVIITNSPTEANARTWASGPGTFGAMIFGCFVEGGVGDGGDEDAEACAVVGEGDQDPETDCERHHDHHDRQVAEGTLCRHWSIQISGQVQVCEGQRN